MTLENCTCIVAGPVDVSRITAMELDRDGYKALPVPSDPDDVGHIVKNYRIREKTLRLIVIFARSYGQKITRTVKETREWVKLPIWVVRNSENGAPISKDELLTAGASRVIEGLNLQNREVVAEIERFLDDTNGSDKGEAGPKKSEEEHTAPSPAAEVDPADKAEPPRPEETPPAGGDAGEEVGGTSTDEQGSAAPEAKPADENTDFHRILLLGLADAAEAFSKTVRSELSKGRLAAPVPSKARAPAGFPAGPSTTAPEKTRTETGKVGTSLAFEVVTLPKNQRQIMFEGKTFIVGRLEAKLLSALVEQPGKFFTKRKLCEHLGVGANGLYQVIHRLRGNMIRAYGKARNPKRYIEVSPENGLRFDLEAFREKKQPHGL